MIEAIGEVNNTSLVKQIPPVPYSQPTNNDTVLLSETARATLMSREGLTVTEIADELGISPNVVLSQLVVTSSTSAPVENTSEVAPTQLVAY